MELCAHSFAASTIGAITKWVDEGLTKFAYRQLTEEYPYLILDARDKKVRDYGIIQSQAVLLALGTLGRPAPDSGRRPFGKPDQLAEIPAGTQAAKLTRPSNSPCPTIMPAVRKAIA